MVEIQSVPTEIRQLDLDVFRLALKDLEDDEEGMPWLDTHQHNPSVTVGGAILAKVIEIINGYSVTFEDGQYAVNLVGANSNVGDVVNVNQVSVRSANSAGLQDLNSLQAASFNGEVSLDTNSPYSGTIFPVGTRQYPSCCADEAHQIAGERGIKTIRIMSSMTFDTVDWGGGHTFIGDSVPNVLLTLDTGADTSSCEFQNMQITGELDNDNVLRECLIHDLTYTNGFIHMCALQGTITLGNAEQSTIMDCYSNIPGGGVGAYPKIDMGGSGQDLALRAYSGGLGIINCSDTTTVMDFDSGRVVFESTVTGGDFTVRGICDIQDDSTGGTITDDTVNQAIDDLPTNTWAALLSANRVVGSFGEAIRKTLWGSQ